MADMDDFDLDRSTAEAWAGFQTRLSEVISMMDDSGDLTISVESEGEAAPFLRFSSPGRDLVRCEAASNATLTPSHRLDAEQLREMGDLGWQEPSDQGPRPTSNFWVEVPQDRCDWVSELAVAALRDVFGVPHPVFLAPDQLTEVLRGPTPGEPPVTVPAVRQPSPPDAQRRLDALVDAELTELYGHPPLRDSEGDVAIRVGSTMIFLRTSSDGQEVVVFAAVVHDIAGRSRAAEVLNDLNVEARWVKFQLVRDRVFVSLSVLAKPFVPEHLRQAVQIMSQVADGIDEELAAKLNGRTTFSEHDGA
jgi:hypothetical protein